MKLNLKKCEVTHLGGTQKYADYLLENGAACKVEESQGEEAIGVWMNGDLKFVDHTDRQLNKRETDKVERVQRMATKLVPGFQTLSHH